MYCEKICDKCDRDTEALEETIKRLTESNNALLAACVEFVRKVDAGEARSVRSYNQMKQAITFTDKCGGK